MRIKLFGNSPATSVLVSYDVLQKEAALVEECDAEVGWFGLVDDVEVGDSGLTVPYVYDILVPKQIVSVASIAGGVEEGAAFSLADFMAEHAKVAHKMKYFGHSHVNSAVFASSVDTKQIEDWSEYGMPYMITQIRNKAGEMYTRLDQFEPRKLTCKVEILPRITGESSDWAKDIIADNVVEKKFEPQRFSKPDKSINEMTDEEYDAWVRGWANAAF